MPPRVVMIWAAMTATIMAVVGCTSDQPRSAAARSSLPASEGNSITTSTITSGSPMASASATADSSASVADGLSASARLLVNGLGPLTFGMTAEQAERAAGSTITVSPGGSPECQGATFASQPAGVAFFLVDGRLAVVELYEPTSLRTQSAISVGSTEADVREAYGSHLSTTPGRQDPADTDLSYRADDPALAPYEIIFTIHDEHVTDIQAGERSIVERSEVCA